MFKTFSILFCPLAFFISTSTIAQTLWTKIECFNNKNEKGVTIYFNENTNGIYLGGIYRREAISDIKFSALGFDFKFLEEITTGSYQKYIYRVNREHGNLNIHLSENDTFITQYQCKKVAMDKLKF
jgi:hypothetical protein